GLVVLVDGKVLMEYGDVVARGYIAGARTAILAMLFGNPVAEGTIRLDATLGDLGLDDRGGLLPVEKLATVEQLLTGRSGVYHPSAFLWDPKTTPARGSKGPGTYFFGHQWGALAACDVYERMTGRDFYQAVQEDLAEPLALQDFRWSRHRKYGQEQRSQYLIYDLYFSARDLARIGQLMLQHGEWEGRQLIPRDWVARITSVVTPREELDTEVDRERPLGFGYYWWVWQNPDPMGPYAGAFTTRGQYGQYLTVLPALHMVVAHQVRAGYSAPTTSTSWEEYEGLLDRLIAARCPERGGCEAASSNAPARAAPVSRQGAASATRW
ncbi:MAG: serine hydrolase, partial [Gemmatimonadota bacterium]